MLKVLLRVCFSGVFNFLHGPDAVYLSIPRKKIFAMKSVLRIIVFIVFVGALAWQFSPNEAARNRLWVHRGLAAAVPVKKAVEKYYSEHAVFPAPADLVESGLTRYQPPEKSAIDSIVLEADKTGVVIVSFTTYGKEEIPAALEGALVKLKPIVQSGRLSWACTTTLPSELTPKTCK